MPKKKTTSKKTQQKPQSEVSGSLLDAVELGNVRIVEAHSKLSIVKDGLPDQLQTKINVRVGPASEGNIILGHVTVNVSTPDDASPESTSTLAIAVHCQCVFACSVKPPDTIPDNEAQMLNAMTLQIAWPYIRAHVNTVSVGMGINAIVLPLMRIQPRPPE